MPIILVVRLLDSEFERIPHDIAQPNRRWIGAVSRWVRDNDNWIGVRLVEGNCLPVVSDGGRTILTDRVTV